MSEKRVMNVYDVVELLKDFPEYELVKGQKGTILEIYNEQDCEIEFSDTQALQFILVHCQ